MSSLYRWSFAVIAALAFAAPVSAQWKSAVADAPRWDAPSTLAQVDRDLGAWNDIVASEPAASPFAAPEFPGVRGQGEDVALMVVGGAALVIGSVIDGDAGTLMMVGGGVVGLLGLFRYVS